jgi:hypothetical protein
MIETEMEMVARHIRGGEAVVARQSALVRRLKQGGFKSEKAEELLAVFRWTLANHYEHLALIRGRFAHDDEPPHHQVSR